tara:strand:- start:136 stop:1344 length:1209 start_codon:yes stop_codon:yes gene_type:complete
LNNFLKTYGTGVLLAATGVGAGDLITSGLAGINHGTSLVWACILGAGLKYFLNEGIARYQIATNQTLLQGWIYQITPAIKWPFLVYLIIWSYFVGGALINACGIAATNIYPVFDDRQNSQILYGIIHSLLGLIIVQKLSFKIIEKIMALLVFVMFCAVILTALIVSSSSPLEFGHIFLPSITKNNLAYVIAVIGGVGGTLTILSYSYWIMEKKVKGKKGLSQSRKDLKFSYFLTGLFSVAMIIIGSTIPPFSGDKSLFPVHISNIFFNLWGEVGRMIFLSGFWSGVFSSLLGVWQSVPYLFADFINASKKHTSSELSDKKAYENYGYFIALVPITTLFLKFEAIQLAYAIIGAFFMPMVALSLYILTTKKEMKSFVSTRVQKFIYIFIFLSFIFFSLFKFLK